MFYLTLLYFTYPADCSDYNFGCLSLKIVKLAFLVLEMNFCLRVSATVIVHRGQGCFVLIVLTGQKMWIVST